MKTNALLLTMAAVLVFAGAAMANTLVLQQGQNGYNGCEDTYLRGVSYGHDYSDNNYGGATVLYTGANVNFTAFGQSAQALIRFNDLFGDGVNQIPANAVITNATLKMYTYTTSTRQYALRWYQMQRDWVEGSSSGTPEAGASCATYRQYPTTTSGGDLWGTDGVASTRLGPLGSAVNPPTNDADYYDYRDPIRVETLPPATADWMDWDITGFMNRWQNGTMPNEGLYSFSMDGYLSINLCSSEYANASLRPKLEIEYTVPEPMSLSLLALGSLALLRRKRA